VLHEIKKQGKNAIYVSGESLLSGFQKNGEKDSIDKPIVNAEYFLLDSFSFIELNTERFERFIFSIIKLNGRVEKQISISGYSCRYTIVQEGSG
jgi:hypothetical protein